MPTMCQVHFSQETDVLTVLIPPCFINCFTFTNFKVLSHGRFIHVDEDQVKFKQNLSTVENFVRV